MASKQFVLRGNALKALETIKENFEMATLEDALRLSLALTLYTQQQTRSGKTLNWTDPKTGETTTLSDSKVTLLMAKGLLNREKEQ